MRAKLQKAGDPKARGAVTSIAVAEVARVSQSTVSLVLSGKAAGRVSTATKTLVEETARRLGYQPNVSAQALRTGAAKTLALAVPNVQQPFFGQIFVAAELKAREHDYAVILIDTTTDLLWAERLVGMIRSRLVSGCIVYANDARSDPTLTSVIGSVLFVEAEDPNKSGVDLNVSGAMRAVVEHLAGLGHQRIGYFAAEYPKAAYKRRFESFLSELNRMGLPHRAQWRTSATFELEAATRRAKEFLKNAPFTALFCDDDLLAGAAYRAARQLGIAIPAQLSIVGFNDIEIARLLDPELTTVAIPADVIGRTAVERLLLQLQRPVKPAGPAFVAELELRVRGSTAPPELQQV
jgi:LacI family transcriptional regulator/LacI family repressor for deo operon, udp, cdd, tsx, nupC, and nupG